MTEQEYFDFRHSNENHNRQFTHESEMNRLIQSEEYNLVAMLRPKIFQDGNQWCVLYGENLVEGIAGFGDSPFNAILDFNKAFNRPLNTNTNGEYGT